MENWLLNDPIGFMMLSFLRNCVYLIGALLIMIWLMPILFKRMNISVGITSFREHIWNDIKAGNLAVAVYAGARVFAVVLGVALIAASFQK